MRMLSTTHNGSNALTTIILITIGRDKKFISGMYFAQHFPSFLSLSSFHFFLPFLLFLLHSDSSSNADNKRFGGAQLADVSGGSGGGVEGVDLKYSLV